MPPPPAKNKTTKTTNNKLQCYNKYQPLQDHVDSDLMEYISDGEESEQEYEETVKQNNNKKPPSLVIHGKIESHITFVKAIKDITNENFHIKYHEEITEIFTTQEQYTQIKTMLQAKGINTG